MPPPPPPSTARRLPAAGLALLLAALLHVAVCLLVALAHIEAALRPRARKTKPRGGVVADDGANFVGGSGPLPFVGGDGTPTDPPALPPSSRPPTAPTRSASAWMDRGSGALGGGRVGEAAAVGAAWRYRLAIARRRLGPKHQTRC